MKYINCGCGNKFSKSDEWINLDFAQSEGVQKCNILKGLPFDRESIDAIFSSCMLEHFTPEQAKRYMKECYRVLRRGGIIRIVVPDLEDVCKEYLHILDLVRKDKSYENKYEYIIIELLDQMARMKSGGQMQKYWESADKDEEYVAFRTGYPEGWGENVIRKRTKMREQLSAWKKRIINYGFKILSKIKFYNYYCAGKFVFSGEIHRWMYDSYSLCQLLRSEGFQTVKVMQCNESEIMNWAQYGLEMSQGKEYKPHSLYVEGKKS